MKVPVIVIVFICAAASMYGGCSKDSKKDTVVRLPTDEAERDELMTMSVVSIKNYDKGTKSWNLSAEKVDFDRASGRTILYGVSLDNRWKRPDGEDVDVVLKAGKAATLQGNPMIRMEGSVSVRDEDGNLMETASLEFDRKSGMLNAPGAVLLTGKGLKFSALGLKADLGSSIFDFTGDVHAVFSPAPARAEVMTGSGT